MLKSNLLLLLASCCSPFLIQPPPHQQSLPLQAQHKTQHIEKFARLPVWPVQNGVIRFLLSLVNPSFGVAAEALIGGSVCPNFFDPSNTNPFILLVHHNHKFFPFDPIRPISAAILPEGFPAHPHRGFITLTIILRGGFTHRDSLGVKQQYGTMTKHGGKFAQWLFTGSGLLHEEMWDTESVDQELYQIWIDVPAANKLEAPVIDLIGDDCPVDCGDVDSDGGVGVRRRRIVDSKCGSSILKSDMVVATVELERAGCVCVNKLPSTYETIIVYVRSGAVIINGGDEVGTHRTAFISAQLRGEGGEFELNIEATKKNSEILLLAGEPINQRIVARGSMVMASEDDVNTAYADYERGAFGVPWSHKLNDAEWKEVVERR